LTTIVVIGKVTPTKAEQAISQAFGNWKNKGSKPQLTLPSVPLNSHSFSVVPDKTSLQDSVTFVQNVPVTLYSPERYALKVGNQVLGQGGFASRLWRDLRVKTGLVYGVSSDFSLGRTRSTYSVTLGSDPGKVSQARAIVYRDVRSMQNKPITALELKRAQGMLVRRIPLFESSVNAIANDLLYYAQHKLPLNQPTIAAHNYLKVTPAAIQAAFRKTLRVGHFVEVVKGPAPK
ncbi:MAG TPA: insulinase family protein, partial [Mizugakiibacter sp.]|nr:insulinase family protein [Mizugakiibacter sp.]